MNFDEQIKRLLIKPYLYSLSLNTRVLHHSNYTYRISVCFISRYNSKYQTRNYSAYMTQLTSLNTCVLHHGYIFNPSIRQTEMSNGHLNVYSSSGQMDISKCPSDIWICPLVQWTNGHIEMSIGHLNVQSSNGRMDMSNASITCKHISAWVPHLELIHNSFQ